ncbi:MAG TPA: hypothetical protein VNC84_04995 [Gammaproteobacteria bacterium]|jgi:hypothetical protein|nr:hypothetical protein [Gammaproteobacteria bacterium]
MTQHKQRSWFAIAGILTLLLTSCSPVDSVRPFDRQQAALLIKQNTHFVPTREWISIQLPQPSHWQRINQSFGTTNSPIMYIPRGENRDNPTESVQTDLSAYIYYPHITAKILMEKRAAHSKQACQTVTLNILQETATHLTYRLMSEHCMKRDDTVEIGKAFNGADAVYVVYYTANSHSVSTARIRQMTSTIALTTLRKQDKHFNPF